LTNIKFSPENKRTIYTSILAFLFQLAPAAGAIVGNNLLEHGGECAPIECFALTDGHRAGGLVVVSAGCENFPPASDTLARPAREECVHGKEQAGEGEDNEYDLMDVILAGRQSAKKVRTPEDGIVPEDKPGPTFTAPVWNHSNHDAEDPHPH
jgi:hypothetical protein